MEILPTFIKEDYPNKKNMINQILYKKYDPFQQKSGFANIKELNSPLCNESLSKDIENILILDLKV